MNSTNPISGDQKTLPLPAARGGWRASWKGLPADQKKTLSRLMVCLAVLTLAFFKPLASLMIYVSGTELHSHIMLVPFISAYLLHLKFRQLPTQYRCSPVFGTLSVVAGLAAWVAAWMLGSSEHPPSLNDHLALVSFAYVCLVCACGFFLVGKDWMTAAAFPVGFLFFIVPLPDPLVAWLEEASKRGSAETADWFFHLAGVPVLRNGDVFRLPGIVLQVATECSGIRSSWVLFITSLVAAHMFLRSPWRRAAFVLLIIPLGLLRNGFRIMVLGWLCVEVGPHMIHSPIHHRGGPLFFALSLIPLLLLVWWLRRGETRVSQG